MPLPTEPKIYHIVHVDRLASIIRDEALLPDAVLQRDSRPGTIIGMDSIKQQRLTNPIICRPGLNVGYCVPFYFCPRSVMLYLIHKANHSDLDYRGGQEPIVHLEASLYETVRWADLQGYRWAFTLSNAGSGYFEDRCDLRQLETVDWDAVHARNWQGCKEGKQAEFLVERCFPWALVQRVGVCSSRTQRKAREAIEASEHQPPTELKRQWYY